VAGLPNSSGATKLRSQRGVDTDATSHQDGKVCAPVSVGCTAPPYTGAIYEYAHDGLTDPTGCSITGGEFYLPAIQQFPTQYAGDYFFADFCGGWIRNLDSAGGASQPFADGLGLMVDVEVNDTGELYYLVRGAPGTISKISYSAQ
jgi:hypothetical protein